MMGWNVQTVNEVFEKLKERVAQDEAFRQVVLENPVAAVKELSGLDVPEGVDISFTLDEKGDIVPHVQFAAREDGELDESELEAVAGGITFNAFMPVGPMPQKPKR